MDDIYNIVRDTVWVSIPEFIRLAFAGIAGGLIGAYINDKLTRRRESESGIVSRKRDFLTYMRGWRKDAERVVLRYDAIYHFPIFFNETIPGFCGFTETIRRDFTGERRKKFESLTGTISGSDWRECCHPNEYKIWLKMVDELIAFVDSGQN